jgi:ergothioneine biosynthesis protein EgtB
MPDVSPTKWHLAHTSWFFETFILSKVYKKYKSPNAQYNYLFNSYYVQVGKRHSRPERGLLSRPTVEQVYSYRQHVDQHMLEFLKHANQAELEELSHVIKIGLHHEQQHQELFLTDIKHIFSINPLRPAYQQNQAINYPQQNPKLQWIDYQGGLHQIGYQGQDFAFDNETPNHTIYLQDYRLANRLVTTGEYLEFIEANGYQKPEYWLSEGWTMIQTQQWQAPLYWEKIAEKWWIMTLGGMRLLQEDEPVCHVSFYEADAYANFRGKRLPTEAEWEVAAKQIPIQGNFLETGLLHPGASQETIASHQFFGDVWEWTQSAYLPYPGFKSAAGAIGEYNGKFMCNQMVLRGGSCVTSLSHIRPTYRNFFPPSARWQFTGIRLSS